MSKNDYLSYEEIAVIYYDNKEIINSIKDGLLSSGFVPNKEKSITLYNENGQVICGDDPQDEKLQSIRSIYDDVIDFLHNNEELRPIIMFREVYEKTVIEFEFRSNHINSDPRAGIIYTTTPKEPWGEVHLEGDWYAYKYEMD